MIKLKLWILGLLCIMAASVSAQSGCESIGWANLNGQSYVGPVTGGGNSTPIQVTSFSALKSAAESSGSKVIYVMNNMGNGYTGTSGDRLTVASNKTIVGYSPGITVRCAWQIQSENIIIRNLICRGPGNSNSEQNWDTVNISAPAKRVWFDHCTIMEGEDGNFDVVKGADNVTATWCKFTYVTGSSHNYSNLVGSSNSESESHGKLNITYAYCWWENVSSRCPRTRYGKIHVLNSYYHDVGSGAYAGKMSNIRLEGCVFENTSNPTGLISTDGEAGVFAIDCIGGATTQTDGMSSAFTPPYNYTKIPTSQVKSMITDSGSGAGPTLDSPTSCSSSGGDYTLTVNTSGNGTVSPNGGLYDSGETVTLTATPTNGATFSNWTGDASGSSNPISITMNSNKTVTAVFNGGSTPSVDEFHNFTTSGTSSSFFNISGNLSTSKGTVSYNGLTLTQCLKIESSTSITFTTTAESDLTLVFNEGWSGGFEIDGTSHNVSSGILTTTLSAGSHTLTKDNVANLYYMSLSGGSSASQYTISTSTNGNGSVSGGGTYDEGSTISLTATPNSGYTFDGWSGSASGSSNPLSVTVDANKSITASFSTTSGSCNYVTYQAESGSWNNGAVETEHSGYTGSGYVNVVNDSGNYFEVTVNVDETRSHDVRIYFANGASNRPASIAVNGSTQISSLSLPSTGGWTTWNTATFSVNLNSGNNTIRVTSIEGDGLPNVDKIEVCEGGGTNKTAANTKVSALAAIQVHNFTTSGKSSSFFNISGNLSTIKGTVNYNGLTLTQCLKIETSTSITFTSSGQGELLLVFNGNFNGDFKIDGNSYSASSGIITHTLSAGSHTLSKDNVANLYYMSLGDQDSGGGSGPYTLNASASPSNGGSVSLSPSGGTYNSGTVVTLTANASGNYSFVNWSGDASGSNTTTTVTMNSNKNVTAIFDDGGGVVNPPSNIVGWATQSGGTTGGSGGTTVTCSTGDCIQDAIDGSTPVTIRVNGTITTSNTSDSKINVKDADDITIIGVGTNGEFNGIGIKIWRASNVIIRNLTIHHVNVGDKDCISIEGPSDHIWVDHCELYNVYQGADKDYYDGLLDAKKDAEYITYSYNYFHDSWKTMLVGSGDSDNHDRKITAHNNYFDNCNSRMPLFRFGNGHFFNNYYSGIVSTGINSRMGACLKVENNYFKDSHNPIVSAYSNSLGATDESGNIMSNVTWDLSSGDVNEPNSCNASIPYSYSAYSASSVPSTVVSNVGVGQISSKMVGDKQGSSLEQLEEQGISEVILYPNPTKSSFTVTIPNFKGDERIRIVNIMGQEVINMKVLSQNQNVKINQLPSGQYIMQLKTNGHTVLRMFVKE